MLDAYLKNYFWTFNLAVLFGAALLLARTVNAFVGGALDTPPSRIAEERGAALLGSETAKNVDGVVVQAFLDRNLFKAAREDLTPEPEALVAAPASRDGEVDMSSCEPGSLRVTLIATFFSPKESTSVAVFQDTSASETIALRVGDQVVNEAKVLSIQQRNVLVDHGGKCEVLSLEDAPTAVAHSSAPPTEPTAQGAEPPGEFGKDVKQISETEYEIPKEEIDNVLSNLNQIATQARIVPSFHNGKANGFKLFSIRPNSLYSKIGIQNGDIVQKINGYEMNSPDKALEIYSKLKDAQTITVDMVRRGKQQTLSYNIR